MDKLVNLGPWAQQPTVQREVIDYMRSVGAPLLMREVADGLDIPTRRANRILGRLHDKGVVTRYRIPIRYQGYCQRRKQVVPGGTQRATFLYSLADGGE